MNERIQVCPHCLKEVSPDAVFCPYCGSAVVQKDEVIEPAPVLKPVPEPPVAQTDGEPQGKTLSLASFRPSKQTLIALFLFVGTIVYLLVCRYGYYHNFFDYDDYDDIDNWDDKLHMMETAYYSFWRNCEILSVLVPIIGYIFLYKLASNRAARFFIIVSIVCTFLLMATVVFEFQLQIDHIGKDRPIDESLLRVISIVYVVIYLGIIYALSVLLRSNSLSAKSRPWIGVLLLRWVLFLTITVTNFVSGGLYKVYNNFLNGLYGDDMYYNSDQEFNYQDFFLNSGLYAAFYQILILITAFAMWHMARSEAFSGPYNATERLRLSPVNKWMGAALGCVAVAVISLYLFYSELLPKCYTFFT